MPSPTPRARENPGAVLSSMWTASRGTQVVHCELVVPTIGPPILRCAYGPHAVIRSQCLPSEDAAAAIAEIWKAALMDQGFRVQSGRPAS
jgi:hypothetical protein